MDPFSAGDRLYMSETDVYRRQILTYTYEPPEHLYNIYTASADVFDVGPTLYKCYTNNNGRKSIR